MNSANHSAASKTPNVRFWASINGGAVKLTLASGETVYHHEIKWEDGVYQTTTLSWKYDGVMVSHSSAHSTRDVDGQWFRCSFEKQFLVADLAAEYHEPRVGLGSKWETRGNAPAAAVQLPVGKIVSRCYRDQRAEDANLHQLYLDWKATYIPPGFCCPAVNFR